VGQNGAEFWVLKFRTMWERADPFDWRNAGVVQYIEDEAGPTMKTAQDPRVASRFARFCRRHSLDELPQLVHVLSGKMCLVGPRPVTRLELREIYGSHAAEVVRAKPGLSGLWQVSGRNQLPVEERCRLDLECARNLSFRLYFHVLWRTIPEVFSGAGAW
jgi:exopolysaccharide production protein ExoY